MSLIGQRRYGGTIDWMFIYSQCWNLTPNMTVFVGGAFERLLGPGVGVLMNEIRDPWALPPCENIAKRQSSVNQKYTKSADTRILDFQPPGLWEINFGCLHVTQSMKFCYSSPNRNWRPEKYVKFAKLTVLMQSTSDNIEVLFIEKIWIIW